MSRRETSKIAASIDPRYGRLTPGVCSLAMCANWKGFALRQGFDCGYDFARGADVRTVAVAINILKVRSPQGPVDVDCGIKWSDGVVRALKDQRRPGHQREVAAAIGRERNTRELLCDLRIHPTETVVKLLRQVGTARLAPDGRCHRGGPSGCN